MEMNAPFNLLSTRELPSFADSLRKEKAGCKYMLASLAGAAETPREHMFNDTAPNDTSKTLTIVGSCTQCSLRNV
jgi:hypothetical protein